MGRLQLIVSVSLPAFFLSSMAAFACPVGLAVDIEWNGSQFDGLVLEGPNPQGNCLVSYDGWDETWNEWVAINRIAPLVGAVPAPTTVAANCPVGAARQIEWNGSQWDGTILEGPNAAGECYVTYDGWDASWNEWVTVDRIAPVAATAADCAVGKELEISWGDRWWAGTILDGPNDAGQCFVTYAGWDASWNEWVTLDRLREVE